MGDPSQTTKPRRAQLIVCFATVYLVWGSTYLVASIGLHSMPPFLFGGMRFICAAILLGGTALALGRKFQLDATEWKHMFVVSLGTVLIANGLTNVGMQHIASNTTAILNASAALWIALFATRGRRAQAIDRRTLTGLVIGFAGTVMIILPSSGHFDTQSLGYQLLILFAVFCWSGSTVYIRNAHSKLDVLTFTAIQMMMGGLMLTAVGLATGESAQLHWSKSGFIAMAYLTVLSSCLAYTAFAWLARNSTPALVGTYSYVNPAIASLLGWWFLDEKLSVAQIIGMTIMFAGVALVSWPQKDVKRLDEDQQKDPSTAGCG
jgi:drug/metabolite transporter (DMT)-like permease